MYKIRLTDLKVKFEYVFSINNWECPILLGLLKCTFGLFSVYLFAIDIKNDLKFDLFTLYSKTCLKRPLKRRLTIGFQDRLSLNTGQKYCRMLQAFCNTFDLH